VTGSFGELECRSHSLLLSDTNCNLGTIGFGNTVTVTARVSRLADAVAGATQVQASFTARAPGPQSFTLQPDDPDGTNNTLTTPVFISR
jgi:hypothetical protein